VKGAGFRQGNQSIIFFFVQMLNQMVAAGVQYAVEGCKRGWK
jgi:hypothetical protein